MPADLLPPYPMPDQTGRTWLVTGATNGVGLEAARAAARAGARVLITARDEARGESTRREIGADGVLPLDLASLDSVRRAAADVAEPIDVLVNNAGGVTRTRQETADGFEWMLGVNALGPFAFTNLVARHLRDQHSRVVITGSDAHRSGTLDLVDPHFRERRWSLWKGYSQSKLADMLWALGLGERLANQGVAANVVHPGFAKTNIYAVSGSRWFDAAFGRLLGVLPVGQSAGDGAQPILHAAVADADVVPPGAYVGPAGRGALAGPPVLLERTPTAADPDLANRFWRFAKQATGTDLP